MFRHPARSIRLPANPQRSNILHQGMTILRKFKSERTKSVGDSATPVPLTRSSRRKKSEIKRRLDDTRPARHAL